MFLLPKSGFGGQNAKFARKFREIWAKFGLICAKFRNEIWAVRARKTDSSQGVQGDVAHEPIGLVLPPSSIAKTTCDVETRDDAVLAATGLAYG